MKPVRTISVVPRLPHEIRGLLPIAHNLRWAWNHESVELFRRLDRELWETSGHNPVLMLGTIEQEKLEEASRDDALLAHLARVESDLQSYMRGETSWYRHTRGASADQPLIAYFSCEFGLTECLSIFAGGLGILAGDHLKSASDLGIPLVGVGLLYAKGYFRQYLNQAGWQQEADTRNDFHNLPLSIVNNQEGGPLLIKVDLAHNPVFAQVWRAQVGRIPLYLLDTNITENRRLEDRELTDQLYGGNRDTRIRQEILLGIGGYGALQALGLEPTVFHMNEGHSAFLALERVRHLMRSRQLTFSQARELASASLVFTTHTPVEAGHDYFSPDLMKHYFSELAGELGLSSFAECLEAGRRQGHEDFCMTVLALRSAARANGVSKLHGQVSRQMWQALWPGVPVDEIPIGHVTNGIHFRSWISSELNQLYDRYLGPAWREGPSNGDVWNRVQSIPAEELWRTHERRRERLVAWARRRVREQRVCRAAPQAEIDAADAVLDPDALTIGFARRFATYKRGTLILRDMDRLRRLLTDSARPVQLIFAGKAHPHDDGGKELIREIAAVSRDPILGKHVVFLEDYDMAVARALVQGVDVWLNTPLRPNEASGTSGMKAAANAVLNLSIPDGWWDEVWNDPANSNQIGWAIGRGEIYSDLDYQNKVEAEALYELLERDVVPTFYDRSPDRIPRRWVERMKASVGSLCRFINTHRMVRQYLEEYYERAHDRFRALDANHAQGTRALADVLERIHRAWPDVRVVSIQTGPTDPIAVASPMLVRAQVSLGQLRPQDVIVELYVGRIAREGDLVDAEAVQMSPDGEARSDRYSYVGSASLNRTGLHGCSVRVRPYHPDMAEKFIPGLICWAQGSCQ
jgi:starch phosphorylase